jgi:transposase
LVTAIKEDRAVTKLKEEHVVTIHVLHEKHTSHAEIARRIGCTEGTVRYHLRRKAAGATDRRAEKDLRLEAEGLGPVATSWWQQAESEQPAGRPPSIRALFDFLVEYHDYEGSYKSVRKFVRRRFPAPLVRPVRRIETPPGAMAQADWGEERIRLGDSAVADEEGRTRLYAFVLQLSHCRRTAVIWSRSMDQLSWHHCHLQALQRLGGVPAVIRIDNLKTGVGSGAGPWAKLNPRYRAFARSLGFHIDPHEPRCPRSKGKVERQVRILHELGARKLEFESLDQLQEWTDKKLEAAQRRRRCPATGSTIAEAWRLEQTLLQPLPDPLPEPFDVVIQRAVHMDCTVAFEGRRYSVPFRYAAGSVEVRGTAVHVQIVDRDTGQVVASHPRGTDAILLTDPAHYEGPSTPTVLPPKPLGRMARRITELAATEVELRSVDYYAQLAEVAR